MVISCFAIALPHHDFNRFFTRRSSGIGQIVAHQHFSLPTLGAFDQNPDGNHQFKKGVGNVKKFYDWLFFIAMKYPPYS